MELTLLRTFLMLARYLCNYFGARVKTEGFVTLSNPRQTDCERGYRPSGGLVFRAGDSAVGCRLFPLEFPTDFDTRSWLGKQDLSIS